LRERIAEELDYEIEAQNHRAVERAFRGHPFARVPRVHTELSSRRVLVTDLLSGRRFADIKALPAEERDRYGEIVFRFYFSLLTRMGRVCGDPHPGNYLLLDDGRVGFLDFGLMRTVDADHLELERALARAVIAHDAEAVHADLAALGYLPDPAGFEPDALLEWLLAAGEWYMEPGFLRLSPAYVAELLEATSSPRAPWFEQMRRLTIPPQALLIRRMEGLVFTTLGELRAGAEWHMLAREFFAGDAPSTALGEDDAAFWQARGVHATV